MVCRPWGPVGYFYSFWEKDLRMAGLQSIGLYSLNIPQEIFRDPETALCGTIILHFMLLQNEGIPEEPREVNSEIFQRLSLGALELPFLRGNAQIKVFSPRAGFEQQYKTPESPHNHCVLPLCLQAARCILPRSYCWLLCQQPGCSLRGFCRSPVPFSGLHVPFEASSAGTPSPATLPLTSHDLPSPAEHWRVEGFSLLAVELGVNELRWRQVNWDSVLCLFIHAAQGCQLWRRSPLILSVSAAYDFCISLQLGAVWPDQMSEQRVCKQMYRRFFYSFAQQSYNSCVHVCSACV